MKQMLHIFVATNKLDVCRQ